MLTQQTMRPILFDNEVIKQSRWQIKEALFVDVCVCASVYVIVCNQYNLHFQACVYPM